MALGPRDSAPNRHLDLLSRLRRIHDRDQHTGRHTDRPRHSVCSKKCKRSPYSIIERTVPELIPVLGSQPAGDVSHKPGGRMPLFSPRPAVTPATLKRAATNFAAWRTGARRAWTVCLRLLPDSVSTAIWTRALLHLSPARYRATFRL